MQKIKHWNISKHKIKMHGHCTLHDTLYITWYNLTWHMHLTWYKFAFIIRPNNDISNENKVSTRYSIFARSESRSSCKLWKAFLDTQMFWFLYNVPVSVYNVSFSFLHWQWTLDSPSNIVALLSMCLVKTWILLHLQLE